MYVKLVLPVAVKRMEKQLPVTEPVSKNRGMTPPVSSCFIVSHRSLTRQRHGRYSKCLKRSTKSCMRGEAAEEGYSRGCRMNVSNGPQVSHISGTSPTLSYQPLDMLPLRERGQMYDHRLMLVVEQLKKHWFLCNNSFTWWLCVSFRIVGTQLVCPSDEGFQWYSTAGKGSSASCLSAGKEGSVKSLEKDKGSTE